SPHLFHYPSTTVISTLSLHDALPIYVIAALQTLDPHLGTVALTLLQMPQPAAPETVLTLLTNDLASHGRDGADFALVLDDYHVLDAKAIDQALAFLLEHLPPQMHLVIATRE